MHCNRDTKFFNEASAAHAQRGVGVTPGEVAAAADAAGAGGGGARRRPRHRRRLTPKDAMHRNPCYDDPNLKARASERARERASPRALRDPANPSRR